MTSKSWDSAHSFKWRWNIPCHTYCLIYILINSSYSLACSHSRIHTHTHRGVFLLFKHAALCLFMICQYGALQRIDHPWKKKKNYNPSPRLSVKYSHGSSEETSTRVKVAQTKLDTEIQWQDHLFITNAATDATVTKAACKALILKAPRRKENIETFRTT